MEEAQQTPDVKTTLSLSHADARSLLLLVEDEQQAPGGIEDDPDLKHLRGPLLNAVIGLRALPSEYYRPPHAIPRVISQLVATLGPLDPSLLNLHLTNICNPTSPLLSSRRTRQSWSCTHTCLCPCSQCATGCPTFSPTRCTACSNGSCRPSWPAQMGNHSTHQCQSCQLHIWTRHRYHLPNALWSSWQAVENRHSPVYISYGIPRYIRLHPSLYENRPVSAEEARQVFRLITQGMQEFHIGNTAQTGLLVMTNRSEVKAALDSRPPTGDEQYIQVDNVVTVVPDVWALSGDVVCISWMGLYFSVLKPACKLSTWARAVTAICAQDAVWILDELHVNLSVLLCNRVHIYLRLCQ